MNSATKPGHYVMERRGKGRIDATVMRDAGEQSRQHQHQQGMPDFNFGDG
jgi:hypothetical protein